MALEGIHVSSIQGEVDWAEVRAAGYRWAIIRLTRGIAEVDSNAERNMWGCIENGVLFGFYHRVLQPTAWAPEVQALHFSTHLNRLVAPGLSMLPPCVDYEDQTAGRLFVQTFIDRVRQVTGRRKALIYTSGSYVDTYLQGEGWMDSDTHLWIADTGRYTSSTKGHPRYVTPRVVAHHYGTVTVVPGLGGRPCDVDVSVGDLLATVDR